MHRVDGRDTRHRGRILVAGAVGGVVALALATSALGQSITGGCTATVNGRDPRSLTKDSPLEVSEGQIVALEGSVPASATGRKIKSTTRVKVLTPFWLPDMSFGPFKGSGQAWGGDVEVPKILFTLASGIYKVNGVATGTGGWRCTGSGYIQLGDAAAIEAGLGGALVAGGAVASAAGRKPKEKPASGSDPRLAALGGAGASPPPAKEGASPAMKDLVQTIANIDPDTRANLGADLAMLIALILCILLFGLLFGAF